MLTRLFGDGNFIPKSEAGKALVPAVSRLLYSIDARAMV